MRKVKTLGYTRNFKQILPGEYSSQLPSSFQPTMVMEEEDESERMPTSSLPAFEPLVLWRSEPNPDPNSEVEVEVDSMRVVEEASGDGTDPVPVPVQECHKVEVIPELASKLRPHQREGVQFLRLYHGIEII